MKIQYKIANRLLIAVAISSVCGQIGIIFNYDFLKYISTAGQIFVLLSSINILIKYKTFIVWSRAFPIVFILAVYPLVRILIEIMFDLQFKNFTDAFIIQGSYYQLVFVGFAIAILAQDKIGYDLLYNYAVYAIPLGCLLIGVIIISPEEERKIFLGHLVLDNFLIPASLVGLMPIKRYSIILGWTGIALVLIVSSTIWSRSYTIVGIYLVILTMVNYFKVGKKKQVLNITIVLVLGYFFGAFAFLNQNAAIRDSSVVEKYQFDSLLSSIYAFMNDGNIVKLFNWEGNSRSEIIIDAFSNFTTIDWLWGKGIFGKYKSFVERNTIEIGWAQELFRWGISYVIPLFIIMFISRKRLQQSLRIKIEPHVIILNNLILIKMLDGFIFGLPTNTVYSLLLFWAVMKLGVLNKIPEPIFKNNAIINQLQR